MQKSHNPTLFLLFLIYCWLLPGTVACVSHHPLHSSKNRQKSPPPPFRLQFVNEQVLPQNLVFEGTPVGGLSALTYHAPTKTFLALSDDKGKKGPPRFYRLKLTRRSPLAKNSTKPVHYQLQIKEQVFLTRPESGGGKRPFLPIDPEGMAVFTTPGKSKQDGALASAKTTTQQQKAPPHPKEQQELLFISSEGAQMPGLKDPPALMVFTPRGVWQKTWPLSPLFWPKDLKNLSRYGVRENKAFEALSLTPDQKHLWLATEQPLHQDHFPPPVAASTTGGGFNQFIRFSRFEVQKQKIRDQFAYPLRTLITQNHLQGQNGVTDFLSLGEKRLLVIERAYLKDRRLTLKRKLDHNLVRLFFADCSRATSVLKHSSLKQKTFKTCDKKQVLDLSGLKPPGPKGDGGGDSRRREVPFQVDNIEGITLGPKVSPHTYLMVLVSDNNFNPGQKTQFLFFHTTIPHPPSTP